MAVGHGVWERMELPAKLCTPQLAVHCTADSAVQVVGDICGECSSVLKASARNNPRHNCWPEIPLRHKGALVHCWFAAVDLAAGGGGGVWNGLFK
jgi:hypothetical protein